MPQQLFYCSSLYIDCLFLFVIFCVLCITRPWPAFGRRAQHDRRLITVRLNTVSLNTVSLNTVRHASAQWKCLETGEMSKPLEPSNLFLDLFCFVFEMVFVQIFFEIFLQIVFLDFFKISFFEIFQLSPDSSIGSLVTHSLTHSLTH